MEKKMNNKGFSLVELIIVIAIMAVLIGILAPQFLKYVEKSRVSTDVTNAQEIASAAAAAYADGTLTSFDDVVDDVSDVEGLTSVPKMKSKTSAMAGNYYYLHVDATTGAVTVKTKKTDGYELYPNCAEEME